MGKGGGSAPAPSTQTVRQETTIPEYFRPYLERTLQRGEDISNLPYQQYGGERIAQFQPMQQQAFNMAQQNIGAYQGDLTNARNYAQGAGRTLQDIDISSYMNPYQQNVIDIAKREAVRQDDMARNARSAQAVGAGAFGGSRQAIMEAEANRNLQQRLGDIQTTGSQQAYDRAVASFGQDRAAQAQASGLSSALAAGTQNLARQDVGLLQSMGGQQQAQQQTVLDQAYKDFLAQRDAPKSELEWYSGILRGYQPQPNRNEVTTSQAPAPSLLGQLGSLGAAGVGLAQFTKGFKKGGAVKSSLPPANYAEGGSVSDRIRTGFQQSFDEDAPTPLSEWWGAYQRGIGQPFVRAVKSLPSVGIIPNVTTGGKTKTIGLIQNPDQIEIPDYGNEPPTETTLWEGSALPASRRRAQDESLLPAALPEAPAKATPKARPPLGAGAQKPSTARRTAQDESALPAAEAMPELKQEVLGPKIETPADIKQAQKEGWSDEDISLALMAAGFAGLKSQSPTWSGALGAAGEAGVGKLAEIKKGKREDRKFDTETRLTERKLATEERKAATEEAYNKARVRLKEQENAILEKYRMGLLDDKDLDRELKRIQIQAHALGIEGNLEERRERRLDAKEAKERRDDNDLLAKLEKRFSVTTKSMDANGNQIEKTETDWDAVGSLFSKLRPDSPLTKSFQSGTMGAQTPKYKGSFDQSGVKVHTK